MNLTLTHIERHSDGVASFEFTPDVPLVWQAGQFIRVELAHNKPDAKGAIRRFTIAAAPHESPRITTRLTGSSFKQALNALPVGGKLTLLDHPAGDFYWRSAPKRHIFAAQGIGITPFYAIIKDRIHRGLPVKATLLYGTQAQIPVIFAAELAAWEQADPTLNIIHVPGTLKPADVIQHTPDYAERLVYVSGPKSFLSLSIPPQTLPAGHLIQDNFPGYSSINY